jgi:hypothetical protein
LHSTGSLVTGGLVAWWVRGGLGQEWLKFGPPLKFWPRSVCNYGHLAQQCWATFNLIRGPHGGLWGSRMDS